MAVHESAGMPKTVAPGHRCAQSDLIAFLLRQKESKARVQIAPSVSLPLPRRSERESVEYDPHAIICRLPTTRGDVAGNPPSFIHVHQAMLAFSVRTGSP
jgi:hypothetical protein